MTVWETARHGLTVALVGLGWAPGKLALGSGTQPRTRGEAGLQATVRLVNFDMLMKTFSKGELPEETLEPVYCP